MKTVVLVSGGLDSAVVLADAYEAGDEVHALTFHYGQRHAAELKAARYIAARAASHKLVELPSVLFEGSALTKREGALDQDPEEGLPATFVPGRNLAFLGLAVSYAEAIGAGKTLIGANCVDYSGYPDCRPEFLTSFRETAQLAIDPEHSCTIRVLAPLLRMSKVEIIQLALELGVDIGATLSCYDPTDIGEACGRCGSCKIRLQAFADLNMDDPAKYRKGT